MSNLRLQKVLYIAHMYHLGLCEGEPLINDGFQAWDYGPVDSELYHHAKGFGADFVHNIFHAYKGADERESEYHLLKQAYEATKKNDGSAFGRHHALGGRRMAESIPPQRALDFDTRQTYFTGIPR